jgi:hypothetical protein
VGLAEFLAARLDDDERFAQKSIAYVAKRGWKDEDDAWDENGAMGICEWRFNLLSHRVLREVEAKRKILALLEAAEAHDGKSLGVATLRMVAKTFAAIWGDHPDFDPAWKD